MSAKAGRPVQAGRPFQLDPSPVQREIIVKALTDPTCTRDTLALYVGLKWGGIRYHFGKIKSMRWLPIHVIEGIEERSGHGRELAALTRPKRRNPLSDFKPSRRPNPWADRICQLLRTDLGAVERLGKFLGGYTK